MGMSAGTSECPRLEQRTVLTDHVEEWKHEHELGHCIRQSHAKKSQQEHWDTQWVEYEHNISSLDTLSTGWELEESSREQYVTS